MLWLGSVQSAFMKKGAFLHARQGFTLLELMVTLAVVGVLAVMAAPALQSFATRSAMKALEDDFTKTMTRARLDALSRNTCVSVCQLATPTTAAPGPSCLAAGATSQGAWQSGWLMFENRACDNAPANGVPAVADLIHVRQPGDARYTLTDRSGTPDRIFTFNARGLLLAGNTTLRLADTAVTNGPNQRNLVLSRQGRMRSDPYDPSAKTSVADAADN